MKGNWIKYVFIIFIILVMIAVIHKVNEKENQKEENIGYVSCDDNTSLLNVRNSTTGDIIDGIRSSII